MKTQLWVDHKDRELRRSTAVWPDPAESFPPGFSLYGRGMAEIRRHRRRRSLLDRRVPCARNFDVPRDKPRYGTGMWTSTLGEPWGWLDYMDGEEWYPQTNVPREQWGFWALAPRRNLRVFEIDTLGDLVDLVDRYPHGERMEVGERTLDTRNVDWERCSRDWDAVHLTADGMGETRLGFPDLYRWDCESTLWFRWCFSTIRQISVESAFSALGREPWTRPDYDALKL